MAEPTSTRAEQEARLVKQINSIPPYRLVNTYLLNSGSNDMAVDGSGGSPQVFSYTPPANYDFVTNRMMIYMQTDSAMSVAVWGDLAAALGQGIEIKGDGVLLTTWKDNIDLYTQCFDVDTLANVSDQAADTSLNARWSFTRDSNGLGLFIPNGKFFEVIINDDLSLLAALRMKIHGACFAIIP